MTSNPLQDAVAELASAQVLARPVAYAIDGAPHEGWLVHSAALVAPRPGLLMMPNWLGVTGNALKDAARVAGERYLVFVADLYGSAVRPQNPDEAGAAIAPLAADRALLRRRAQGALQAFEAQAVDLAIDLDRLGAFGFCFGGCTVLEMARAGIPLKGYVSLHGTLDTPDPDDARRIRAPLLVLHGANDPLVPQAQVQGFIAEMQAAPEVDWQLVQYGGAVHSFSSPVANVPGVAEYHPRAAARAFRALDEFFTEAFATRVSA
jgi:dienelactone hydrolase